MAIMKRRFSKVMKFGGSSVGTPERIKGVIEIVKEQSGAVVVVSAFQGVTDQLVQMGRLAAQGKEQYRDIFKEIEARHIDAVKAIVSVKNQSGVLAHVKMMLNELDDILHGISLIWELSDRCLDFIMAFGERLSAYIIAAAFEDRGISAGYLDARTLVRTDENFGSANFDRTKTYAAIRKHFKKCKKLQILTGFVGSTEQNETTTLGRGGSDLSASIFGAALEVQEIEIWTDVDGVMTSDPRKVSKAFPVDNLTYEEAMELSYWGAKVIYPPTMQPALDKKIPIRIKNTFNPAFPGTLISEQSLSSRFMVRGITSISSVALLRIQGSGMIGVAGIAARVFGALANRKISIILITQSSSEHSICFAVDPKYASHAKKAIEKEFSLEIGARMIDRVVIDGDLSIIAIVGENMKQTPGISGRFFKSLGKNGVNIVAIAQGSSELNISAVIEKKDETKALNAVHDSFFLSGTNTLNVFLVGTGHIGGTLLKQIEMQKEFLARERLIDIRVVALANSRKMMFDEKGTGVAGLDASKVKSDMSVFVKRMKSMNLPNSVLVDCTAIEAPVEHYEEILDSSISIVTPNKRSISGNQQRYNRLKQTASKRGVKFLYETTVGAGLPVVGTLGDLMNSGDEILKIEAILSGTISYIFNNFKAGVKFSHVVKEAQEKGYTEPDPRDDLNGLDFARKLLILARESGMKLELFDIKVENILPEDSRNAPAIDAFFKALELDDGYFEKMRDNAAANGTVLRYTGVLEAGKASISLKEVDRSNPFYFMSGSDNIVAFTTNRYRQTPLVVKGPGAGAEVTAAGVFADILRIGSYIMQ